MTMMNMIKMMNSNNVLETTVQTSSTTTGTAKESGIFRPWDKKSESAGRKKLKSLEISNNKIPVQIPPAVPPAPATTTAFPTSSQQQQQILSSLYGGGGGGSFLAATNQFLAAAAATNHIYNHVPRPKSSGFRDFLLNQLNDRSRSNMFTYHRHPVSGTSKQQQQQMDPVSGINETKFGTGKLLPVTSPVVMAPPPLPPPLPLPFPVINSARLPLSTPLPPLSSTTTPTSTTNNENGNGNKKFRPKRFQCPHCQVSFSNNGQLKGHIRIHTGERPFLCDHPNCGKTFTRNEELTRHKRIHTGLRPFACNTCNKRFGRKDHLKKHVKTHQRPPPAAPIPMSLASTLAAAAAAAAAAFPSYPMGYPSWI